MKPSIYNIYSRHKEQHLIYNLYSSELAIVDEITLNYLKSNQVDGIHQTKQLVEKGMLIDDALDECAIVKSRREQYVEKNAFYEIFTTTACNARCYYCYEAEEKRETMTIDIAEKICNKIISEYNGYEVVLSWFGGEPLCNIKVIDYITERLALAGIPFRSYMSSNSYLFDENLLDKAVEKWNLKRVQVTLDSLYDDYNRIKNFISPKEDPFERVIKNMHLMMDRRIIARVRVNFDPSDMNKAEAVLKFLKDNFTDEQYLIVYGYGLIDNNIDFALNMNPDSNPYIKMVEMLIDYGYAKTLKDLMLGFKEHACMTDTKNSCVFSPSGKMHKCQRAVELGEKDCYGIIGKPEIDKDRLRFWEYGYAFSKCDKCICLPICQGGCKYRGAIENSITACCVIKNCLPEMVELYYSKLYSDVKQ